MSIFDGRLTDIEKLKEQWAHESVERSHALRDEARRLHSEMDAAGVSGHISGPIGGERIFTRAEVLTVLRVQRAYAATFAGHPTAGDATTVDLLIELFEGME